MCAAANRCNIFKLTGIQANKQEVTCRETLTHNSHTQKGADLTQLGKHKKKAEMAKTNSKKKTLVSDLKDR